ncbi:enoyl-CoA hydratase/isomerase family protein [Gammaproteobacteria bacterium]|nr:enoyl-CoA hydratase/isomerase family protein [Gammaproteobacteria bacterium]
MMNHPSNDLTFPIHIFESQAPDGIVGRIHFNRPAHLNVFNHEICRLIHRALDQWQSCDQVKGVIFTGEGRAFCAGGDLLALYHNSNQADCLSFFHDSYRLITRLHAWPKLKIGLCQGYILGGGLGHAMAYDLRLITPDAKLGMPEVAIAFFPDVGARYFLPRYFSKGVYRYLSLTGAMLDAGDAIHYGLVDGLLSRQHFKACVQLLLDQPWQSTPEVLKIVAPMLNHSSPCSQLAKQSIEIEKIFGIDRFDQWWQSLNDTQWKKNIQSYCPQSVHTIFHTIQHIVSQRSIEIACQADYQLAKYFLQDSDFFEGVRAKLVDKNHTPKWSSQLLDPIQLKQLLDQAVQSGWS